MELLYKEESYKIRGAAFSVYKELGCGYKEGIYQKAMFNEMKNNNLKVEKEKRIDVFYKNEKVGTYIPDFLINEKIIIETKVKPEISKTDIQQFWHYLTGTNFKLGFLINFGKAGGVQIIRRIYDSARNEKKESMRNISALNSASFSDSRGFTTLISTIVIGAIGVTVVTSILLLGANTTRTSVSLEQSQKAKQLANACGETALQILHDNFSYVGTAGLTLGDGSCTYTVTSGAGENRTISAIAVAGNVTRKIQINVTQLTGLVSASWQEVQ